MPDPFSESFTTGVLVRDVLETLPMKESVNSDPTYLAGRLHVRFGRPSPRSFRPHGPKLDGRRTPTTARASFHYVTTVANIRRNERYDVLAMRPSKWKNQPALEGLPVRPNRLPGTFPVPTDADEPRQS